MSSAYEIFDTRARLFAKSARLDLLHTGCRFTEGPAYFPAGRYLIWSDIPNDRLLRYDECDGSVSVFRQPSNKTNGNIVDRQGRLISCEHGARRVTRTEIDGSITVLADRYDGKKLNSPNDAVVKSDGSVWFTDPQYGIDSDYNGFKAAQEQPGAFVYRIDPTDGSLRVVIDTMVRPNGLAFSPDETILYVADTGGTHVENGPAHIRKFAVQEGSVTDLGVFAECTAGMFDGFRVDSDGRIWSSAGDGVHVYDPDGTLLGKILVPESVANVCFGGPRLNYLYITATSSLYGIPVQMNGAKTF